MGCDLWSVNVGCGLWAVGCGPWYIDVSSWQCRRCNHSNDMNRKRCLSCQAWKDGITPMLLAKQLHQTRKKKNNAANFVNHPSIDGSSSDKNTHPNVASTCIGTSKDEMTSPSKGRNKK